MDSLVTLLYVTIALLVLGVLLAFSPTIILTEIAVLTKSKKPFLYSVFFIAGVAAPILLFGAIAVLFIDPSSNFTIPQTKHILKILPVLDVLIGILFIIAGIQVGKKRSHQAKKEITADDVIFSTGKLFWFGFLRTATRLSGLAAILLAAQLIKQNLDTGISTVVSLVWLVIIAITPLVVLLLLQRSDSKYFVKIASYSDKVASLSWRKIISIGLIVVGTGMILYGIFLA
jgi:hypothetical protein